METKPTVCVLLSTYHGEKYLREQLESLKNQEGVNVKVFARDDAGETDNPTISILKEHASKMDLTLADFGKNLGFAKSFSWLVENAPQCDYYAFCDQDDVWKPNKLKDAVKWLSKQNGPSLYYSNYTLVDEKLKGIKDKPLAFPKDKKNFLLETIICNKSSGCTQVFNSALRDEFLKVSKQKLYSHDFTLICLAAAIGTVFSDEKSQIFYRQHNHNTIGTPFTLHGMIKSLQIFFSKKNKCFRSDEARRIYENFGDKMSESDKENLRLLANYRKNRKDRKQFKKNLKKFTEFKATRALARFMIFLRNL